MTLRERAEEALRCLYIAVDESIADDVSEKVHAAFADVRNETLEEAMEEAWEARHCDEDGEETLAAIRALKETRMNAKAQMHDMLG